MKEIPNLASLRVELDSSISVKFISLTKKLDLTLVLKTNRSIGEPMTSTTPMYNFDYFANDLFFKIQIHH